MTLYSLRMNGQKQLTRIRIKSLKIHNLWDCSKHINETTKSFKFHNHLLLLFLLLSSSFAPWPHCADRNYIYEYRREKWRYTATQWLHIQWIPTSEKLLSASFAFFCPETHTKHLTATWEWTFFAENNNKWINSFPGSIHQNDKIITNETRKQKQNEKLDLFGLCLISLFVLDSSFDFDFRLMSSTHCHCHTTILLIKLTATNVMRENAINNFSVYSDFFRVSVWRSFRVKLRVKT